MEYDEDSEEEDEEEEDDIPEEMDEFLVPDDQLSADEGDLIRRKPKNI